MYKWHGHDKIVATIIGDSIIKWVRAIRHTDTQSIPGLDLDRAFQKVKEGTLDVVNYSIVVIHVGTNNIHSCTPEQITEKAENLTNLIAQMNPSAKIAVSGILPRPIDDKSPWVESNRRKSNLSIRKNSKAQGIHFIESWRAVLVKKVKEKPKPSTSTSNIPHQSCSSSKEPELQAPSTSTPTAATPRKKKNPPQPQGEQPVNIKCFADDWLHLNNKGIIALGEAFKGNIISLMEPGK
jgi:lysophospholipase L1-like esterase